MAKQEFLINKLLTLKLEGCKTYIYVAGKKFKQCRFLMLNIPIEEIEKFDEIKSIDEVAEIISASVKVSREPEKSLTYKISPVEEFWGLCSNLQVWYEYGYNTKMLQANLAFPLLKKLSEAGDLQAKRIFKEEIVERYNTGVESVREYLRRMNYLDYLSLEELFCVINDEVERNAMESLIKTLHRTDNLDIDIKKGGVVKLRLQAQKLKMVPKSVRKLVSLKHLIVSYNMLEELPDWLEELEKLKILEISNNCLKTLPDSISNLKSLEKLNVSVNKIQYLPESFGNLKSLRFFESYQNKLKSLPESIGNLKNLEMLDLNENKLQSLPDTIGDLKNLKKLRLHKNELRYLPLTMGELKNLKILNLSNNKLRTIPELIGKMICLELLATSYNPLYQINKGIYDLPNLKDLWLSDDILKECFIEETDFKNQLVRIHYKKKN